ncbi:MAG: SusD/RagB family nutrient-binding outer membrane lipoprotein [Bacteroidota bacterium]
MSIRHALHSFQHSKFGIRYSIFLTFLLFSCTKDFPEINTNPNEPDNIDPRLQFSYVLNRAASERSDQWRGNLIYCSIWSQQLSGSWETDRYITANEDWLGAWWNNSYQRLGKDLFDIINKTEEGSNLHSMATIFKVFFFQRLTDMYGDIPYSQANQGAVFPQPQFDRQEDIYKSFIEDLTKAVSNLDQTKEEIGNADILYNGDVGKWKRFGNSLLLRIALRISKVEPELAKSIAQQAVENGVMMSNDDIAYVSFSGSDVDGPNANGVSEVFQDFGITGHLFRYSDEFVNFIINNEDPREDNLMETYRNDGSIDNSVGSGNHLGRPNGIDPGNDDFVFAQPRRDVMVTYNAPAIYMSYAEVEFLRAEAIVLGWIEGDAQQAYENGIFAACKHLSLYPNAASIDDDDILDYLEEFDVEYDTRNALEQINTQKWIALLFDGFEAYANQRRSGFPKLTPGLAKGESDGEIPRRLRYPIGEKVNNAANYQIAVDRLLEGDVLTSRMWWDVN